MEQPSGARRAQEVIAELPLFRQLPQVLRERIAVLSTLEVHPQGHELWQAGDEAALLTVIVSGLVKVVRHGEGGDVILELFGPGDTVGAVAVYQQRPYPATAIAMQPTTVLRLPRHDWMDLIAKEPTLAHGMMAEMSRLNASLTRKFAGMHGTRVSERIASLFLTLADRMGRERDGGVLVPLELSRQEIASMVGTTIESAIRVMSRWNREGLLLTTDEGFVIPNRVRLEAAGTGDQDF